MSNESSLNDPTKRRIAPIDGLRGIAHVVMALEHTTPFLGTALVAESYTGKLAGIDRFPYWTAGLATNIASPIFWTLAGVSVALFEISRRRRQVSQWDITRFLFTRALFIILLDLTVCHWTWSDEEGNVHVLLSLGLGLLILSFVRLFPVPVVAALALLMLLGYQEGILRFPSYFEQASNFGQALWFAPRYDAYPTIEFPLLGWFSLMLFGYALGRKLSLKILQSARSWLIVAALLLGVWFALRLKGNFGDFVPYQSSSAWFYFLFMSKAPPSLTYLTFNLGLSALVLSALFRLNQKLGSWLPRAVILFGQTSLFFFVIHITIFRLLGKLIIQWRIPMTAKILLSWLTGLLFIIPLCRAYLALRKRYPNSILKYG